MLPPCRPHLPAVIGPRSAVRALDHANGENLFGQPASMIWQASSSASSFRRPRRKNDDEAAPPGGLVRCQGRRYAHGMDFDYTPQQVAELLERGEIQLI